MSLIKSVSVTERGQEQIIETNAPFDAVVTAFYATTSTEELIEALTSKDYIATQNTVSIRLNYDDK